MGHRKGFAFWSFILISNFTHGVVDIAELISAGVAVEFGGANLITKRDDNNGDNDPSCDRRIRTGGGVCGPGVTAKAKQSVPRAGLLWLSHNPCKMSARARVCLCVCLCGCVCVCVCVCVAYDAPSESQAQLDPHAVGLTDERVQSLSMTVSRISSSGNLDRGFNWTAERDRFCSDAGTKPADASSLFNTDARRRWCFIQNLAARSRTVPIYLPKTWRSIFFAVVIERTPASLFDRPTVASSLWNLSSSNAGVDIGCPGDIWFKDLMG